MLLRRIVICCFLLGMGLFRFQAAHAQFFAGANIGPMLGRTVDGFAMLHPHSTDGWSYTLGAGYTFNGPFLPNLIANDGLTSFRNKGYHGRFGFRNNLVGGANNPAFPHHTSHLFWGADAIVAHFTEEAWYDGHEPGTSARTLRSNGLIVALAAKAGYAWNVFPQSRDKKLFLDFGLRMGFPINPRNRFIGTYNYIPGLGPGITGNLGLNGEFIVVIRYELYHGRYGYNKAPTLKRKKLPKTDLYRKRKKKQEGR